MMLDLAKPVRVIIEGVSILSNGYKDQFSKASGRLKLMAAQLGN